MEELTDILIFKTNIKTQGDKILIQKVLMENPLIQESSVDCEDIDCVLRVVSSELSMDDVIKLINKNDFQCQELE